MDYGKIADAVAAVGFVFIVGVLIWLYFHQWLSLRKASAEMEEREAKVVAMEVPDRWVWVKHRGMVLMMRAHEKQHLWDNMTRMGRNEQVEAMRKAIKQRKVNALQLDSETTVYVPLTANLKRIRDDYNEFKKLGQILSEDD